MLRSLSFRGIPSDVKLLRTIIWKVLLGYLPTETHKWEQNMKTQQKIYQDFTDELIVRPQLRPSEESAKQTEIGISYGAVTEHPLSNAKDSLWGQYFED